MLTVSENWGEQGFPVSIEIYPFLSIRHEAYSKLLVAKYSLAIKMTCQVLGEHMTDDYAIDILISSEF